MQRSETPIIIPFQKIDTFTPRIQSPQLTRATPEQITHQILLGTRMVQSYSLINEVMFSERLQDNRKLQK
jgi:hypothetical protein